MKQQPSRAARAHLLRYALYLLLLLAICMIPLAVAQRVIIKRTAGATARSQPPGLPNGCGLAWRVVTSPNSSANTNILFGVAATSSTDGSAVGTYYDANFTAQSLIEHWDGSAWAVSSSPNPGVNGNQLNAIAALASNNVWAVGFFTDGNSIANTLVEHWDGASWNVVPSPNNGANGS